MLRWGPNYCPVLVDFSSVRYDISLGVLLIWAFMEVRVRVREGVAIIINTLLNWAFRSLPTDPWMGLLLRFHVFSFALIHFGSTDHIESGTRAFFSLHVRGVASRLVVCPRSDQRPKGQ